MVYILNYTGPNSREEEQGNMLLAIEKAKGRRRNVGINPDAFDAIYQAWNDEYPVAKAQFDKYLQKTPSGLGPNPREVEAKRFQIQQDAYTRIHQRIINKYGADGERAWRAIGTEMEPSNLVTGITKLFYDSDREGAQAGGFLGAATGGLMAFFLTGGGSGGWMGIAGVVLGALMGAWAGNKIGDWISPPAELPPLPKKTPASGPSKSPEVERETPTQTVERQTVRSRDNRPRRTERDPLQPKTDDELLSGRFIPPWRKEKMLAKMRAQDDERIKQERERIERETHPREPNAPAYGPAEPSPPGNHVEIDPADTGQLTPLAPKAGKGPRTPPPPPPVKGDGSIDTTSQPHTDQGRLTP